MPDSGNNPDHPGVGEGVCPACSGDGQHARAALPMFPGWEDAPSEFIEMPAEVGTEEAVAQVMRDFAERDFAEFDTAPRDAGMTRRSAPNEFADFPPSTPPAPIERSLYLHDVPGLAATLGYGPAESLTDAGDVPPSPSVFLGQVRPPGLGGKTLAELGLVHLSDEETSDGANGDVAAIREKLKKTREEQKKKHKEAVEQEEQDCIKWAERIEDKDKREAEIKKCKDDAAAKISSFDADIDVMSELDDEWITLHVERLKKQEETAKEEPPEGEEKPCPCCVVPPARMKKSGASNNDVHEYFGGSTDKWPGAPEDGLAELGSRVLRRIDPNTLRSVFGGMAYFVELYCKWTDHTKCKCACDWSQMVKAPYVNGGMWYEDTGGLDDEGMAETGEGKIIQNRAKWKKICKKNTIYVGDYIQIVRDLLVAREVELKDSLYFRTTFYSSSAECDVRWASIDWKLTYDLTEPPTSSGKWTAVASVIGTDSG